MRIFKMTFRRKLRELAPYDSHVSRGFNAQFDMRSSAVNHMDNDIWAHSN